MTDWPQVLSRLQSLPTLPTVVMQLSELSRNENAGAADFEQAIRPDPALTANLLRIANSAYFSSRTEITSVRQAIVMMGLPRVFELALTGEFSRTIPTELPVYRIRADVFWLHCVAVAILTEKLTAELQIKKPALSFVAGLLHDIGKLVIGTLVLDTGHDLAQPLQTEGRTLLEAEFEILGTDHTVIGAQVAERWRLPAPLATIARGHHDPDSLPAEQQSVLLDLVHVSDALAHSLGYGTDIGELHRDVKPSAFQRLGLHAKVLENAAANSADQIQRMTSLFATASGRPQ